MDNREPEPAINDNNDSAAPQQHQVPTSSLEAPSVRRRGAIGSLPIDTINLIRLSNFSLYPEGSRQNEFSTEELRAGTRRPHYLRRRRRRRTLTFSNSDSQEEVESSPNEYIDYRNFPLNIDWFDVEDENSEAFEILKQYGNVGLAIYSKLKNTEIKKIFLFESCFLKLIDCYLDAILITSEERKLDKIDYSSLIQNSLPNLTKIKEIINNKVYNQKDYFPIKVCLDIYEHHYTNIDLISFEKVKNDFFEVAFLFYSQMKDSEIEKLYNALQKEKNLSKKYTKLGLPIFRKRRFYLNHYEKLKLQTLMLIGGNSGRLFVL